jgi:hypothetical protein
MSRTSLLLLTSRIRGPSVLSLFLDGKDHSFFSARTLAEKSKDDASKRYTHRR